MAYESPRPPSRPIESEAEKAEKTALKTSHSTGEKLFDLITYGGIAGVGTFFLTIPVGYWAKYGGGAKHFENATNYLTKQGLGHHFAHDVVNTSALMQGGNIALIPIKLMENHKPEIVDKLNKLSGDKSGNKSVDEDTRQTWLSLGKSRVVAWLSVFTGFRATAAVIGPEKFGKFEESFAARLCETIGKPTHVLGKETPHFRYGKIAALDVFATIASSIILYTGSRFFAKANIHWDTDPNNPSPKNTAPEAAPAQPSALPEKRYTDTIQPKTRDLTQAPAKNYTDTAASQKHQKQNTPLGVAP